MTHRELVQFMRTLGYEQVAGASPWQPSYIENLVRFDEQIAREARLEPTGYLADAFVRIHLREGFLVPVISENDVLFAYEIFKEEFAKLGTVPAYVVNHPIYRDLVAQMVREWTPQILLLKKPFRSGKLLRDSLKAFFLEQYTAMFKTRVDTAVQANTQKTLAKTPANPSSPLYLMRLRAEIEENAAKFCAKVNEVPHIHALKLVIQEVFPEKQAILLALATQKGTHHFMITTEEVMSLSSGYGQGLAQQVMVKSLCLQHMDMSLITVALKEFTRWALDAHNSKKFAQIVTPLDTQDLKRLVRIEQYLKQRPFTAKNNGRLEVVMEEYVQWTHMGSTFLIAPHYLINLTDARVIFMRATTQTPLQEVETSLLQSLLKTPLTAELKRYLLTLYRQTTDLRIKA